MSLPSPAPPNPTTNLTSLTTELPNPHTSHLTSTLPTTSLLSLINTHTHTHPSVIASQIPIISAAVDDIVPRLQQGGRAIYFGAGTSGRLGVLDASECRPTFGSESFVGVMAGGDEALRVAKEGVEDSPSAGAADLAALNLDPRKDVAIGITASGRTPYVLGGLRYARKMGCVTVGLCCARDSEMERARVDNDDDDRSSMTLKSEDNEKLVKHCIVLLPGPEVVAGSTRMKAGTVTKLALNLLSTCTMIKLGKTYGNLMIDVAPTNHKLVVRAHNLIRTVVAQFNTSSPSSLSSSSPSPSSSSSSFPSPSSSSSLNNDDLTPTYLSTLLASTHNSVKLAIAVHISGLDVEKAREVLEGSCGGRLDVFLDEVRLARGGGSGVVGANSKTRERVEPRMVEKRIVDVYLCVDGGGTKTRAVLTMASLKPPLRRDHAPPVTRDFKPEPTPEAESEIETRTETETAPRILSTGLAGPSNVAALGFDVALIAVLSAIRDAIQNVDVASTLGCQAQDQDPYQNPSPTSSSSSTPSSSPPPTTAPTPPHERTSDPDPHLTLTLNIVSAWIACAGIDHVTRPDEASEFERRVRVVLAELEDTYTLSSTGVRLRLGLGNREGEGGEEEELEREELRPQRRRRLKCTSDVALLSSLFARAGSSAAPSVSAHATPDRSVHARRMQTRIILVSGTGSVGMLLSPGPSPSPPSPSSLDLPSSTSSTPLALSSSSPGETLSRDEYTITARAGGLGYLLGDEGSGFDIGKRAIRAVVDWLDDEDSGSGDEAEDGRKEDVDEEGMKRLRRVVLAHFGVTTKGELITAVYTASSVRYTQTDSEIDDRTDLSAPATVEGPDVVRSLSPKERVATLSKLILDLAFPPLNPVLDSGRTSTSDSEDPTTVTRGAEGNSAALRILRDAAQELAKVVGELVRLDLRRSRRAATSKSRNTATATAAVDPRSTSPSIAGLAGLESPGGLSITVLCTGSILGHGQFRGLVRDAAEVDLRRGVAAVGQAVEIEMRYVADPGVEVGLALAKNG